MPLKPQIETGTLTVIVNLKKRKQKKTKENKKKNLFNPPKAKDLPPSFYLKALQRSLKKVTYRIKKKFPLFKQQT